MAEDAPLNRTKDINEALRLNLKKSRSIRISGELEEQESIAAGITKNAHINMGGVAGDYLGAFNGGAIINMKGDAGRFAGANMSSGRLAITGTVGTGFGIYLSGGTIICNGDADDCLAQGMVGGVIVVKGDTGNFTGLLMKGGTVVILGDVGLQTGSRMSYGRIFASGKIAGIAPEAKEETLSRDDRQMLTQICAQHDIDVDLSEFRKVIAKEEDDSYAGSLDTYEGVPVAEED